MPHERLNFFTPFENMQILNMPLNISVQMEIKMKLNCFTPAPWRHHWQPSPSFYLHSALSPTTSWNLFVLSCMHRPVQPKSLSWWGKVGNSLILQHFGSPTVSYVHSSPANPWLTLFNIEGPHQSWIGSISLEVLSTASSIRWFHLFIWMKQFPQVETVSSDQKIASLIDIISPCILLFLSIHKVHIPHIITATSILRHAISCLHWRGWTNLLTVFGIT